MRPQLKLVAVALDAVFESEVEGVGNEGVPNRNLVELRNRCRKKGQVVGVEVVAGIDAQTQRMSQLRRVCIGLNRRSAQAIKTSLIAAIP